MIEMFEEALESPAFWILGAGAVGAEVLGYIIAKRSDLAVFPWWQFAIVILGTLVAAAYFATKD